MNTGWHAGYWRSGILWRSLWALLALAAPMAAHAQDAGSRDVGQDVGTQTPPELREFRLDDPPPRPAPQESQPQPVPVPPPATATLPETPPKQRPAARSEQPPAGGRVERPSAANAPSQGNGNAAEAATDAQPGPESTAAPALPSIAPETLPSASADTSTGPAATQIPAGGIPAYLWLLVGGVLAAGLAGTVLLLRRRRRAPAGAVVAAETAPQPSPPARLDGARPLPMPPPPEPSPGPSLATAPSPMPGIEARFEPSAAQLSIASLTVTGRLVVENRLPVAIDNLMLRSQMISAQTGQAEAIAAFHADKAAGSVQMLGNLAPGERIDATIEIRLPRAELASFRWTEREFIAPIVLINIAGVGDATPVEARLSQLIGRESEGRSARMKPLPVDRGPKRFSEIGARPVFA